MNQNNEQTHDELPPSEDVNAYYATWSKDGSKILFTKSVLDIQPQTLHVLHEYDLALGERRNVLSQTVHNPDINPDEDWIAFSSGSGQLFKYNPSTKFLVQLTGDDVPVDFRNTYIPRWSPTGDKLLFSITAGSNLGVAVMNPDGSDAEIVVPGGIGGSWFPDGEHIVYISWDLNQPFERQRQLFMARADGSYPMKLTDLENSMYVSGASVSPDGSQIAFTHQSRLNTLDIFLLDVDSGSVRQLTNMPPFVIAQRPRWHPDGDRLLFVAETRTDLRLIGTLYTLDILTKAIQPVFPLIQNVPG